MTLAQLIELVEYGTDIEVVKWLDKNKHLDVITVDENTLFENNADFNCLVSSISPWDAWTIHVELSLDKEKKHMKFYEIKEPYFALIAAKDEKQCLKLYKDIVCEVEDEKEFFDDMKTIDKYEAFKMLAKSHTEEGDKTGAEEAFNQLENLEENGEVLLIDGGLI